MMLGINKLSKDEKGDILLSLCAVVQSLLSVFQLLLGDAGFTSTDRAAMFRVLSSALMIVLAFPIMLKRNKVLFFRTYSMMIVLFLISVIINENNFVYIGADGFKLTLAICLPVFVAIVSVRDISVFLKTLKYISILTLILGVFYTLLLIGGSLNLDDPYNMSFGYAMLLPMMYLWYSKNLVYRFLSLLLAIIVFFVGSRGPSVIFFTYVLYGFIKNVRPLFLVLCISLFYLLLLNFESILFFFIDLFGFESRSIYLLMSGEMLTHTSGREDLYEKAIQLIFDSPFSLIVGYGIYGARTAMGGAFPHNMGLELMLDFGFFMGIVLLIYLFSTIIVIYLKIDKGNKNFFMMLVLTCLLPLMVSGSYILDYNFYLLLGVMYLYKKNNYNNLVVVD